MADCPTCEYHKQRAQIWRDEAYRLAGHPMPERDPVLEEREACANLCWKSEEDNAFVNSYNGKRIDLLCAELIRARGQA